MDILRVDGQMTKRTKQSRIATVSFLLCSEMPITTAGRCKLALSEWRRGVRTISVKCITYYVKNRM